MEVYSLKSRKPRYWVMHKENIVFEDENASKVIQWAIDHLEEVKKP